MISKTGSPNFLKAEQNREETGVSLSWTRKQAVTKDLGLEEWTREERLPRKEIREIHTAQGYHFSLPQQEVTLR